MLKLDQYCIDILMDSGTLNCKNETYWFPLNDGYLLVWPDGQRHHTHHNPANFLED